MSQSHKQQEIAKRFAPQLTNPKIHGRSIVFDVTKEDLLDACRTLAETHGLPVKTVFAEDHMAIDGSYCIHYVFGVPKENLFVILRLTLKNTLEFPSLTGTVFAASLYEGGIREMFGLEPVGRSSEAQPTLLHENWPQGVFPMRKDFSLVPKMDGHDKHMEYHFAKIDGEGIYEVPVGPVHAGIIEPGHFRFSMAGERIINLEAKLGWMHKGSEKLFESLQLEKMVQLSENISGDSAFTHSTAFCQAVEELAGIEAPALARYTRVIYGEMERLAAHTSDIGFILSDTGFNFGLAQCGRLREQIMQMNEKLAGHRFLRGVNTMGGVLSAPSKSDGETLIKMLDAWKQDFLEVMAIADDSSSVFDRLLGAGVLARNVAEDYCAVGVPARASGLAVDVRADFPYAGYAELGLVPSVEKSGDVLARFTVRKREVLTSIELINKAVASLPGGPLSVEAGHSLEKNSIAVGMSEGWRGEIVYVITTDAQGTIARVSLRDPSFLGWHVITHAAPGNVILDFPLINKSFNLSYTGFDK
jgi:Ni,Fe-hydrogenase III large subunit/Ni,Fe-hydrogenase III component G